MAELGTLLDELTSITAAGQEWALPAGEAAQARLVQLRLGIAASLFAALQCKHAATAGHGLRVALTSSAWARKLGMGTAQRDLLEVAALLHDIGIIGVPDQVLLKPGALDSRRSGAHDVAAAPRAWKSCAIAAPRRRFSKSSRTCRAWYDGSSRGVGQAQARTSPCPRA